MVKEIKSKKEWDETLENAGGKLVAVDFTATWCGPCKQIGPEFVKMADQFPDVVFIKVDVDECADVAAENEINCMPTFKFFKNKALVDEFSGANADKLKEFINKHK